MAEPSEEPDREIPEAEEEAEPDMPLTMTASVVLTNLPTNAKDALRDAGVLTGGKDGGEKKITVHFRPVSNAPSLPKAFVKSKVSASQPFSTVVRYLRRRLQLKETESVFCYLHQCFSPGLDENMGSLFTCFKTGNELVVGYAVTPAWG